MTAILKPGILLSLWLMLSAAVLSGCGAVVKIGQMPDVSRLERNLALRESTREDVSRIFHLPRGKGG